jgi:protein phosphatase
MTYNISAFTHKGTGIYESNEDRVLINGWLLDDGEYTLKNVDSLTCFVADGVGGKQGGSHAAEFVLTKIKNIEPDRFNGFVEILKSINLELIDSTSNIPSLKGCACTLSGIISTPELTDFYHIGDTELWLLRDDMFMKITKDEVLNEDNWRSPITNYFGGDENNLEIDTDWVKPDILPKDLYMMCSDGLFKSLNVKLIKPILASDKTLEEKILKLKENTLSLGSDDNVSVVLIEVTEANE